jgi:Ca2+/H+ antiporter, TMEM165/GDT1 family
MEEQLIEPLKAFGREGLLWLQQIAVFVTGDLVEWIRINVFSGSFFEWAATAGASFALIAAAEIGDKSQIVCMTLAARHRGWPVLLGATSAFALLNLAAVLFGAAVATWVPEPLLALVVAVLFALFGVHALRAKDEAEDDETVVEKSGHGIFFATFLLIVVAEFGDKTQIAVAGLSCCAIPASVWMGATAALAVTSALGVLAGRTLLQRIPVVMVHRISGAIFLLLAAFAAYLAVVKIDS